MCLKFTNYTHKNLAVPKSKRVLKSICQVIAIGFLNKSNSGCLNIKADLRCNNGE